jgi:subfamily B ATP-binding cassette protein MsbA
MVIFGASDGVVPFLVKQVLDGVFAEKNRALLALLPLALITFAVVRALSDFGQQYLMAKVGHTVIRDIRNDIQEHLLKLSPDFFLRRSSADILARVTGDVLLIRSLLTDSLAAIIRDSIRIVALLASAVYLDPKLAGLAVLLFPVGIFPVYKFGKKMRRLSKRGQEAVGSLSALLQESIIGNQVVKIFSREQYELVRFTAENSRLSETFIRSERVRASTGPINEVLASLAISGVLLYGGYSVMNGTRSQGDFIAFLIAVFLLYDPYKKLSKIHSTVQQALAAAERLFEILDVPVTIHEKASPRLLGIDHDIRFEQVSFCYGGSETFALRRINLAIPQGKKTALVGFSGSGKSTLISLIPRFVDPTEGCVLLGGIDVRDASIADVRSKIALVAQHTFLFNTSIFDNIAYGKEGATQEMVEQAARAAFAYDFITALPEGFQTLVGEGGFSLSGGERQRIAIARALLKDAPILILDEATASLDNRSEREVQEALERLEQGRTTIVVAHRLSTVRTADMIVVLSEGQIVETGTHDQLLERGGEYAHLYSLQFREKEVESDIPTIN